MATKNLTLSIEEELLAKAKSFASTQKTTVNSLFREYLKTLVNKSSDAWIDEFWIISDKIAGNSKGVKFSRDQLHER